MNIVTCVSYHGTGSGAVDDYLRSYSDISFAPYEYECRFLQDPDGVKDLEYHLVSNYHRLNSDYAIKKYLKFVNNNRRHYSKIFGDNWITISNQYVQNLMKFQYKGYWHADILELPFLIRFIYKSRRYINRFLPKPIQKPNYYNYFRNKKMLHSRVSEQEFCDITKSYINSLCETIGFNKDYVVLDQCVPTNNISDYTKYFDNIKVIVVDRDPRDSYIEHKKAGDHVLPKNVEQYCIAYRDYRLNEQDKDNECVMRIMFEDLIYHFEDTERRIIAFLDLKKENQNGPIRFNPDISIKNTRLWEKYPEYEDDVKYIETHLSEFLYDNYLDGEE